MANQVAARLKGDDFQHLLAWHHVLELKMPLTMVESVRVEDADALSVDDVTVRHSTDSSLPDRFFQIKYHVDQRSAYSTDVLIARPKSGTSLLEKFFRSWCGLRKADPSRLLEVYLVSNWPWSSKDRIGSCISGDDYSLTKDFFEATSRTKVGSLRDEWQSHLRVDDAEFSAFCKALRLKVGFDGWSDRVGYTAERMDFLGLKSDESAILIAVGIVRNWIKSGQGDITVDELESVLRKYDLYLPPDHEPAVHVYLTTIKAHTFDVDPDYIIDWRDYFLGPVNKRGHQLNNPDGWNSLLLPELEDLEVDLNAQAARLLRTRGKARLSAWFAFGHTFSQPNDYIIELEQNGRLWRTDANASANFALISDTAGETIRSGGLAVAVAISITADITDDVRRDVLGQRDDVSALLVLRPDRELGPICLQSDSDVVSLAEQAKKLIRDFVRTRKSKRLLLYYCGPFSGACFIGHRFNAVCPEIQIMEYDQSTREYHPSFLLR